MICRANQCIDFQVAVFRSKRSTKSSEKKGGNTSAHCRFEIEIASVCFYCYHGMPATDNLFECLLIFFSSSTALHSFIGIQCRKKDIGLYGVNNHSPETMIRYYFTSTLRKQKKRRTYISIIFHNPLRLSDR